MTNKCDSCKDGFGFVIRQCPGCKNQKPVDDFHSRIYSLPVGFTMDCVMTSSLFEPYIEDINCLFQLVDKEKKRIRKAMWEDPELFCGLVIKIEDTDD